MDTDNEIQLEPEGQTSEDKIKKLNEELKKCRKEKEEYLAGWQRAKADFINARKDEEKQREQIIKFANQMFVWDLLTVLDSFELALTASDKTSGNAENVFKGFSLIKLQFEDILKKYGLKTVKSAGEKFNPEIHESVAEVDFGKESGIVVEEIQKGYTFHGKVIRPAKVKVSK